MRKNPLFALIIANLYPLIGVAFLNWNAGSILVIYWIESVIIGYFSSLKIKKIKTYRKITNREKVVNSGFASYYLFMFVHAIFIFIFVFTGAVDRSVSGYSVMNNSLIVSDKINLLNMILVPSIFFLISHSISFFQNFINGKEYTSKSVEKIISEADARMVLMHLTVLFGGTLYAMYGSAVYMIAVLVLLKTFYDLNVYKNKHKRS